MSSARLHRQEATSKSVYSVKAQKRNQSDLYKSAQQQEGTGQDSVGEEAPRPRSLSINARSSNDHPGRPSPDPNPGSPSMYQRAAGLTKSLTRHLALGITKTIETVRPTYAPAKVLERLIASVVDSSDQVCTAFCVAPVLNWGAVRAAW